MNTQLIPIAQRIIQGQPTETIHARKLHEFLESKQDYSAWIRNRISKYGFENNEDFCTIKLSNKGRGGHNAVDHYLTLDMAKELSMVEKTEKGRQARRYFLACEKELKSRREQPSQLPLHVFPQEINDYIDLTVSRIVKDAERASEEHLRSMAQERLKLHTPEQTIEWLKEFQEKGARPLVLVKEDVNLLSVLLNLVEVNARKTLDKINSHIV